MIRNRGILVHPEEFDAAWLDRAEEAGLTRLGLHPVGGQSASESLERAIASHGLPEAQKLRAEAARRGIEIEYEAHTAAWLLPRSLFSAAPEWFRMDETGERRADCNLCPSNSEALSYIAERTATLSRLLYTGSSRHFYWLDDVSGRVCHCPACKKLTPGDQQLRVVNAMLMGLKRENPTATVAYLAYCDTLVPPKRVQPLDGVFLEYAPFHRDSHRPLCDADSAENAKETKTLCELLACFGKKGSQALEYWMDNSRFSNWTKPPKYMKLDEEVMKRDVAFYDALGFETVTSFGCYLGNDYQALYGEPPVHRYGQILRGEA